MGTGPGQSSRVPGTGPCARRTSSATPDAVSATADVEGLLGVLDEEDDGRAGAGDESRRGRRSRGRPRGSGRAVARASTRRAAGRCAGAPPRACASPRAQRLHEVAPGRAGRAPAGLPGAGRSRRRPRASTVPSRERDHPVELAAGQGRGEPLAAAGADAVPPTSANGTSEPSSAARSSRSSRDRPGAATARRRRGAPPRRPPNRRPSRRRPGSACGCAGGRRRPTPVRSARSGAARTARLLSSRGTRSAWTPSTVTLMSSASRAVTSSVTETAWKTLTSSWYPSRRSGPTTSARFTLPGARAVTVLVVVLVVIGSTLRASSSARRRAAATAANCSNDERLAPGARVDPGGPEHRLGGGRRPGPPREGGPQRLAPLGERGVDAREDHLAAAPASEAGRAGSARRGRSRRSAPARRRCAGRRPRAGRRRTRPP